MKILVVCGSYPPIKCGVGDYARQLYSKMADKADITVLTSKNAETDEFSGVKILNIIEKWRGLSIIRTILKEIKKGKYDLIHFQFPTVKYVSNSIAFFIVLPIILRMKGKKVVYTIHEYSNNRWISKVVRKPAIYMSNKIIVVEDSFKTEMFKRNKLINKSKIEVVHIGSNIPRSMLSDSQIAELKSDILKSLNVSVTRIISYFGFVNASKRLDIIFNALGELKKENKLSTLFLIVGEFGGENRFPELFKDLYEIIDKYHLQDYVYVTGYVDSGRVGDYLRVSDAALLLFKNGVSVRNGSMLAAQQEGIRIITTKPETNLNYFSTEQFSLIENNVEQVKREIFNLQCNPTINYPTSDMSDWNDIALRHLEIYSNVLNGGKT